MLLEGRHLQFFVYKKTRPFYFFKAYRLTTRCIYISSDFIPPHRVYRVMRDSYILIIGLKHVKGNTFQNRYSRPTEGGASARAPYFSPNTFKNPLNWSWFIPKILWTSRLRHPFSRSWIRHWGLICNTYIVQELFKPAVCEEGGSL